MIPQALLVKAGTMVLTGVVGVGAYELLRKVAGSAPVRWTAVAATEVGLRGARRAETVAESARLKVGDVVAEARERIGEEAPMPAAADVHDHDH